MTSSVNVVAGLDSVDESVFAAINEKFGNIEEYIVSRPADFVKILMNYIPLIHDLHNVNTKTR